MLFKRYKLWKYFCKSRVGKIENTNDGDKNESITFIKYSMNYTRRIRLYLMAIQGKIKV